MNCTCERAVREALEALAREFEAMGMAPSANIARDAKPPARAPLSADWPDFVAREDLR